MKRAYVFAVVHVGYVEWRTDDGRTGSDPLVEAGERLGAIAVRLFPNSEVEWRDERQVAVGVVDLVSDFTYDVAWAKAAKQLGLSGSWR